MVYLGVDVKIKVALHGMDKRCEERMLTIFSMNFKGQCESTDIEHADTVIFDMDDKNVKAEWELFRTKHSESPVIIMAKEHIEIDNTIYISKPAKLEELLSALKRSSNKEISTALHEKQNTKNVANALQSRISTSRKSPELSGDFGIYYNPEKFLQGKVVQAIKKSNEIDKDIFLKCWKDHWILISPRTHFLLQNINDNQIQTFGLVPLGNESDQMAYSENSFSDNEISHMANTPTSKVKIIPIDQFLWNLTNKTARGRVPEGTSLDELYVVQHWPNLTRLLHLSNASRITAFWINNPQSINNVVEKLNIPIEDVLTYFSAAYATGVLKSAKRKEDALITPDVIKTDKKKHNIFSALIKKVSKNIIRNKADDVVVEP